MVIVPHFELPSRAILFDMGMEHNLQQSLKQILTEIYSQKSKLQQA